MLFLMADDVSKADDGQTAPTGVGQPKVPSEPADKAEAQRQPTEPGRRGRPSKSRGAPKSSDDAQDRWTVRGVPTNIRKLAVASAESRGLTVGDWVAEAIAAHARADTNGLSADARSNVPAAMPSPEIAQALETLSDRLTKLEQDRQVGIFARLFGRRS